jgi:hypothetical protein
MNVRADGRIKAIETTYLGCRFRSRLEARWACFFSTLGLRWEYEPQGFLIPSWDGERKDPYLPDFRLLDLGTWVEVKGSLEDVTDDYLGVIADAIDWGGHLPGVSESEGTTRGLLWLGPIPSWETCLRGAPAHAVFQHHKGGCCNVCHFTGGGFEEAHDWGTVGYDRCFDSMTGREDCAATIRPFLEEVVYSGTRTNGYGACPPGVMAAYIAARSARFERGRP